MRPDRRRMAAAAGFFALPLSVVMCTTPMVSVPSPAGGAAPAGQAVTADTRAMEREVFERINRHRAAAGLPMLRYEERIATLSREHSVNMANGVVAFGHGGFQGRSDRVARTVTSYASVAENVAYNDRAPADAAAEAVEGWLASRDHRTNIDGTFDLTGVGVARDQHGTFYFTQFFVQRR